MPSFFDDYVTSLQEESKNDPGDLFTGSYIGSDDGGQGLEIARFSEL